MKCKIKFALVAAYTLLHISCGKKNEVPATPAPDNLVYQSACTTDQIFWLADNETILLNDFCNGTLKKINTTTKSVTLFDLIAREHLVQQIFYTEQLPQIAFYLALTKDASGAYSTPFKLYSLNLT